MRLAREADVRQQLGLQDLPDYVNMVNAALDYATLAMEDDLRTTFERGPSRDIFLPNTGETLSRFGLSRGFVDPATVRVTYSRGDYGNQPADITAGCDFNYEAGTFRVSRWVDGYYGMGGAQFAVSYQAGFPVDEFDPDQFAADSLPKWLVTTCQLRARMNLVGQPALETAGIKADGTMLQQQYNSLIGRKVRYLPDCILPRS